MIMCPVAERKSNLIFQPTGPFPWNWRSNYSCGVISVFVNWATKTLLNSNVKLGSLNARHGAAPVDRDGPGCGGAGQCFILGYANILGCSSGLSIRLRSPHLPLVPLSPSQSLLYKRNVPFFSLKPRTHLPKAWSGFPAPPCWRARQMQAPSHALRSWSPCPSLTSSPAAPPTCCHFLPLVPAGNSAFLHQQLPSWSLPQALCTSPRFRWLLPSHPFHCGSQVTSTPAS